MKNLIQWVFVVIFAVIPCIAFGKSDFSGHFRIYIFMYVAI